MTASPASANFFANMKERITSKDPTDIPLWLQTILVFGEYGSGKSTLGAQFEDHAYYDIQFGAQNLKRNEIDGLKNTWASFCEFVDALMEFAKSGEMPFKTLIIDGPEDLWTLCQKHVFAANGWKEAADGDRGAGWIAPRAEFKRVVSKLFRLHKAGLMGTVFLAHEEQEELKIGLTYAAQVAVPKLSDKDIKVWLPGEVQMVLRAVKTNVNPMDAGEVWDKRRFILQSSAGESHARVKDRSMRLPPYLGTSYETLLAQYNKTNDTKEN